MKKVLSLLTVLAIAVVLVACNNTAKPTDLDEVKDHLVKVEVNNGKNKTYGRDDTFYGTTANVTTMNHYNTNGANESDMYSLIVGTLYQGDFDWAKAVEDELAPAPHDLSKVDSGDVSIHDFSYKRYPSLAKYAPYSVTNDARDVDVDASKLLMDTKWRIELKDDITFEDGLKINAYVYAYSWKQLLSPKQNNVRVEYLTSQNNMQLKNALGYYRQGKDVDSKDPSKGKHPAVAWEDVGFKVISDTVFEIELTHELTQWELMGLLTSGIYAPVHPEVFEASKDVTGTKASYGSIDFPIPASGPYLIKNWQDGTSYTYYVNEAYKGYRAGDYDIKALNYVVNSDETSILNEYEAGNVDVAGVGSAIAFPVYKEDPLTKFSPTTSTFRFALGAGNRPAESQWEHSTVSNAAMSDVEFRQALYMAFDRDNLLTVRPNVKPSGTFLTSLYQATEEANESYRGTEYAQNALINAGLTQTAVDNYGHDATKAVELFNNVYARLDAANKLENGKIYIQIVLYDAESNRQIGNWGKAQIEERFGTDKIEVVTNYVSEDETYAAWDNSDFDLTFSGWQGMQFEPAGILAIVYSSLNHPDTMLEGTKTDDLPVSFSLANFKAYVEGKGNNASAEELAILAKLDSNGVWNGILDIEDDSEDYETAKYGAVADLLGLSSLKPNYDGKKDDFASMTAGIESALVGAYIAVPLFENVGAAVYSERVVFDLPEYHTWMGWGGLLYRSLSK